MTTLVTGATGFAGINIVRALAESGTRVVALDTVGANDECIRYIHDLADKIQFVIGDVLDTQSTMKLAEETGIRRIVHAAAITPSGSVESLVPTRVINVNLMGTVNMLEIARKISAERFVFVSSSGVYGAPKNNKNLVTEASQTQPGNLYSICKLTCEMLMKRYKHLFDLSAVVGRMSAKEQKDEEGTEVSSREQKLNQVAIKRKGLPFEGNNIAIIIFPSVFKMSH